ncbi:MAG: TIGR01620 family protein [Methylobacteriaceae bacterium]|nr:TIGR01620 family protein [Methylobacteriaceae bacterium]
MSDAPAAPRRPRAFRLDAPATEAAAARPAAPDVALEETPDAFEREAPPEAPAGEAAVELAQSRGVLPRALSWGGLFWSAVTGLVGLGFSLWLWRLIEDLFARVAALGWVAAALAGLAALALVALLIRETRAIFRQRRIARLHQDFAAARAADDRERARALTRDLVALYAERADTARARQELADLTREIVDGRDLIDIAERALVQRLDSLAQREIALAARRVSVVTAVSPRAAIDLLFVGAQAVRLVRRIAEIYGGRPGFLGFVRLARSVGAHLAVTGGMAVGDSLIQQVVGHGLAAKLSARLGEGVLNGLLTARVGLSAMAVCRPMPFAADPQPGVADVAPFLFASSKG